MFQNFELFSVNIEFQNKTRVDSENNGYLFQNKSNTKMAGRAKGIKAKKHPNDFLDGGEACRECGKEFNILSSYKRHLLNVHKLAQGKCEEIVEETKKKFFPEEQRFATKKVCPAPGCRAHFSLKSSLTVHMRDVHPR